MPLWGPATKRLNSFGRFGNIWQYSAITSGPGTIHVLQQ